MNWPFGLLRKATYGVIYADPAWAYETYSRGLVVPQRNTAPDAQHYPVMHVKDMAQLPVDRLAAPDCALFMWVTSSHMPQALWLAERWGFTYASKAFCWAKLNVHAETNLADDFEASLAGNLKDGKAEPSINRDKNWFIGMGHGTRRNTEDCLLFTRGGPERVDRGVRELIVAPVREHSRKPDEAYDRIERLFRGPYCELFARNRRPGWSSWGNEADKY